MPSRSSCCASAFSGGRCNCPPGPRGAPGPQGPPGPGGLLACAQLAEDFPAVGGPAFVPAFATILAAVFTSTTGKIFVLATMSLDIVVTPNGSSIGEGTFRILVDGILPPVVSAEQSAVTDVNDYCVALSGCTTVSPGVPHFVELQWVSGTPGTALGCQPIAESDEEHATIVVWERP